MRPIREIPSEFFEFEDEMATPLPLVEKFIAYLAKKGIHKPLEGFRLLLVQHQLPSSVAMVDALIRLGVDPKDIHWLDIPYTSRKQVRNYMVSKHDLDRKNLHVCSGYRVLKPYASYQHKRTVETVIKLGKLDEKSLLVLDDGAYVLKALTALKPDSWPKSIVIVEQTTRGIIKIESSAALRAAACTLPIIDVASSVPKRTLEPPFIAMAVCASLKLKIHQQLTGDEDKRPSVLILGYGTIGEQVASFLAAEFEIDKTLIYVHDPSKSRLRYAESRGFKAWDRSDLSQRFNLVLGCSGRASFRLGDREYLADGCLMGSCSSGAVELSRKEFLEFAEASKLDDIKIQKDCLNQRDIHSDIDIQLVDRTVTLLNSGFPINFNGLSTIPSRFIQQTRAMMVAAAVQASGALMNNQTGRLKLERKYCRWLDKHFRDELGEDVHYLDPPPEEAW